jgi:hypothetical protein
MYYGEHCSNELILDLSRVIWGGPLACIETDKYLNDNEMQT